MPLYSAEDAMITKSSIIGSTVDIDVKVVEGRDLTHPHVIRFNASYFVEVELNEEKKRTSTGSKGDKVPKWDETFVFAADLSSRLNIRIYCKHNDSRNDHVIGETTLDFLNTSRNENIEIDIYGLSTTPSERILRGHLTLHLKVSISADFLTVKDENRGFPTTDLWLIPYLEKLELVNSLSSQQLQKISPAWSRFLNSLGTFGLLAEKIAELDSRAKVAVGSVVFALKIVIEQINRDEKIERLIRIMDELYLFIVDADPVQKISSFRKTLERLLSQTTECAYFIADYQKIKSFAQRAIVGVVSNADAMITQFEGAFGNLKIELILGTSLQTAVVSFRILQKVENIENLMYINYLPYSKSASWDSGRTCLRGTRQTIIDDVVFWASNTAETQTQLYLLLGPPGCGKSTIAHTIAQIFHRQGRLGAAVFLDGCVDQKVTSQTICSTIAFQLSGYDSTIRDRMAAKIRADTSLASADIKRQFPDLIVAATKGLMMVGPVLIVVDGLSNPAEQQTLLDTITEYSAILPPNFHILLTSRYGKTVTSTLGPYASYSRIRDMAFEDSGAVPDTEEYINSCLRHLLLAKSRLAKQYNLEELHNQFSHRAMQTDSWVFIVYRSLLLCADGDECLIMDQIQSNSLPRSKEDALDQLYRAILNVIPSAKSSVNALFHTLIKTQKPLPLPILRRLEPLPSESSQSTKYVLDTFHTLGYITGPADGAKDDLVFNIHPNLEDFLTDPRRSNGTGSFVDKYIPNHFLVAELCLDDMNQWLKFNICGIDDIMVFNREIKDRKDRIHRFIPENLQYACRNWVSHLFTVPFQRLTGDTVYQKLKEFLFKHLLHWVELMSILNSFPMVLPSLEQFAAWLEKHPSVDNECNVMTMDGIRFIRAFHSFVSKAAMQTYISALPLMPSDSILFKQYHAEVTHDRSNLKSDSRSGWELVNPPPNWGKLDENARIYDYISSVTSHGHLIAQADISTSDASLGVSFYHAKTGHEVGHRLTTKYLVECMAFSPDGQHLITTGKKEPVSVWEVKTAARIYLGQSPTIDIPFVRYSANGATIIAIDIADRSYTGRRVCVWNASNGQFIACFTISSTAANMSFSAALSPDGEKLAVANVNGIQLIDVNTGDFIDSAIVKHKESSLSLTHYKFVWSPNGRFLATSSAGRPICLRSLEHGDAVTLAMKGQLSQSGLVCIAFSPDSSCIAAIHSNRSQGEGEITHIRLWDTHTGILICKKQLDVHESWWNSTISFLPDGQEILIHRKSKRSPIRLINPSPAYMNSPPSLHESNSNSQPAPTIKYSLPTSSATTDFSPLVDSHGWIINLKGERHMWVPYSGFDLSSEDVSDVESQGTSSLHKILEVKHPETKKVVLRLEIYSKLTHG